MIETTPTFDLTTDNIESFLTELEQYRAIYHDLFRRREQREQYNDYLQGLLLDIPNKSVETMILHMHGDDSNAIRRTQHFVSEGAWHASRQAILERHWQEVSRDLGTDDGVLIVDESGFPKQGQDSVGVKRQWCGQLGKKANCQVGVFTAYASEHGYTLLDRRLRVRVPHEWVEDDAFAERREKCGVPSEITFKTKPQLALEMIEAIHAADTLPFRWVVCDEGYGRDTAFLDQVAEWTTYFAEVPCDTRVWRERPATHVPEWSGRSRKPTQEQLLPDEPDAREVRDLVTMVSPDDWSRHTIKEGAKGLIRADFVCLRVVAVRNSLPGPDVWLVTRSGRDVASGELKYYLSNAPVETLLTTFVWLSGMRWPIETCFENGKQELGLGDYQMRSWTGWHHHMTLCTGLPVAHFFLVRLKSRLQDKAPDLTLPQTMLLLKSVLPQPTLDTENALEIVNYYQRRHEAAHRSHRKRRLKRRD